MGNRGLVTISSSVPLTIVITVTAGNLCLSMFFVSIDDDIHGTTGGRSSVDVRVGRGIVEVSHHRKGS